VSECLFSWPLAPPVSEEDQALGRTHICRRRADHDGEHRCQCGDTAVMHDEGGTGFHIERLWAYVAVHDDGDEGIVGATVAGNLMPLVAADKARLDQLRPWAEAAARASDKAVRLVRFDRRTDVETIRP